MTVTSIFPPIVLVLLFLLAAKLIINQSTFYQQAVQNSSKAQYKTLDGLRGFLALGVFFHHAIVYYQYFQIGVWQSPPSRVYAFLGQGAVSFFFMITGFLFWSKIIVEPKLDLKSFYAKRALRVYPMYWFSLIAIILIGLIISNFSLKVSLPRLILQIASWVVCGIYGFSDTNEVFPDINYSSVGLINAGVNWTLTYELQFYLILPLLALFAQPLRFIGLFSTILVLSLSLADKPFLIAMNFLLGMTAAYLVRRFQAVKAFWRWQFSFVIGLLLIAIPTIFSEPYIYRIGAIGLIFCAFTLIAHGNSLFGLLMLSASKLLGIVSYSVYLMHGIVLFCIFHLVNIIYPIRNMSPLLFWILTGACGIFVISLSAVTYRFIEYPFLRMKPFLAPAIDQRS